MAILPSPVSSPSITHNVFSLQPSSRKRQRSLSMESDASSSSLKRSVTDPTSRDGQLPSPRADRMSSLSLTDDIDSYMAEQGKPNTSDSHPAPVPRFPLVPLAEKFALVKRGKERKMEKGETWYLISRVWWKRWNKACTGEVDKEGPVTEQDLGPIDNSGIVDARGNIRSDISEGVDFEYIPEELWLSFVAWYGEPIHPLPRQVIERGEFAPYTSIELYPPRLKVFLLTDTLVSKTLPPLHQIVHISSRETITALCKHLASLMSQNPDDHDHPPYRIWRLENFDDEHTALKIYGHDIETHAIDARVLEASSKTLDDGGINTDDCFAVEFKKPSGWIVQEPLKPPITVLGVPGPIFKSNEGFFNRMSTGTTKSSTAVTSVTSLTNTDDSYDSLLMPVGKWKKKEKTLEPGTVGLGNMGNTCFMNSALQCLAHNQELTEYFLTGLYQEELNPDNPLGMHGAIAEAFGALLQRLWTTTGPSSFSPREFKAQLQRFAPQFSGYQQHDSQELLAFLLDGLHEDLNRVLKKPYVAKPDWEAGGDLELMQFAKKSWEGYMMRNDSVIVDLFQGQYQSTLICPECEKVSITFDPFMYLTLPLPIQKKWKHDIFYVPWDLEKPHVKIPVEISRDSSFKDLRSLLGRWMDAPPDNLLTLEIFSHKFYKNLDDTVLCGDMMENDVIVCFELPCHAQQSRMYNKAPGDPFIVPVYLSDMHPPFRTTSYTTNRGNSLFGYPMVIAVDQQQATDVDAMYDIVANRLQRWTLNPRDLFDWEAGTGTLGEENGIDDVPIKLNGFPPIDAITEIKENGDVVTVHTPTPPEADIVDEKRMDDDVDGVPLVNIVPRRVGTKKDVFTLKLQVNHKDYGTAYNGYSTSSNWHTWDRRRPADASTPTVLLRENDAFYCEFDDHMKAYYFGGDSTSENLLWNTWTEFVHPEYAEAQKAGAGKKQKGISLEDCLQEFTKEEQLGEDDLWYCPRCKKHQQATKKFDLWKAPDVLVVHLKRFSNSRTLRDKIDAFVDFPVDGLDLGSMVGERAVAKRLMENGVSLDGLELGEVDEPLVYDLFGVDEHLGGLGGGHYRAYVLNHATQKWYHFDDSYVTPARATDAVNANAYLLFYRRRSSTPLGGKTHQKLEEARSNPVTNEVDDMAVDPPQLPTPPSEDDDNTFLGNRTRRLGSLQPLSRDTWSIPQHTSNARTSLPSPSPDDPPGFDESQSHELILDMGDDNDIANIDPLLLASDRYDIPDPGLDDDDDDDLDGRRYGNVSPSSSLEAEADEEEDCDVMQSSDGRNSRGVEGSPAGSPSWHSVSASGMGSSSEWSGDDGNPFDDVNVQKEYKVGYGHNETAVDTVVIHEKTV